MLSNCNFLYLLVIFHFYPNQDDLIKYYPTRSGELVEHTHYTLDYNEANEQPNWVVYKIHSNGNATRKDNFRIDPKISTGSATLQDYKGSGYDRGHLKPAGSSKSSTSEMSETFFMSNMSPQKAGFNRGVWKRLETLVRNNGDGNIVITGPVLTRSCGSIGNGVTVPCSYYKVVYDQSKNEGIGFILKHESSSADLKSFSVTIDEVESQTGIDFFSSFTDQSFESDFDKSEWNWSTTSTSSKISKSTISSTQCLELAKSTGNRCKNKTTNDNGYCYAHQPKTSNNIKSTGSGRCQAITKAGSQCMRSATNMGYCWQHD